MNPVSEIESSHGADCNRHRRTDKRQTTQKARHSLVVMPLTVRNAR